MRRTNLVVYLICCYEPNTTAPWDSYRALLLTLVCNSDINALIFDYLTTEGYPSGAAKFSREANLRPRQEEESLRARRQIQQSIHSGNIQEAIEALNELEPQVSIPHLLSCFPLLWLESFMHHSYSLRVGDEKNYPTSVLSMSKTPITHHFDFTSGIFPS